MTSAKSLRGTTPQAHIDADAIKKKVVNTGAQASWLKNPDGVTQGKQWELTTCGIGCNVSEGCQLCLWMAELAQAKKEGRKIKPVRFLSENLDDPSRWPDRNNVFLCPKGDFLHRNVTDGNILETLDRMKKWYRHNYIFTTKRPERLSVLCQRKGMSNVYVGVSVESKEYMWRAEHLLEVPPGFRLVLFASPMLTEMKIPTHVLRRLSGIICSPERGGEGRNPRPCDEEWVMALIDQAKTYNVPFFFDVNHNARRVMRMGGKYQDPPKGMID